MEYNVRVSNRRLVVDWSCSDRMLSRTLRRYESRAIIIKVKLFLPEMIPQHRANLYARFRRFINGLGFGRALALKIIEFLSDHRVRPGIYVSDALLLPFMEFTCMDDICSDIDLIGFQFSRRAFCQLNLNLIFAFSPDDFGHFLDNRVERRGVLCYGRNGNSDL